MTKAIYYLNNRTNIDHIYIYKRILKFKDIIDLNIYKYIYKAWYNHNIHHQNIKLFNKNKSIILSDQLIYSLFPIYHVIMKYSVLVIKVL